MLSLSKSNKIILLFLILAIAVFFRLYKLTEIPPGLYPDVAINGNNALDAIKTGDYKVFYPENNGREGLFMNLIAASFLIFGASVWAIKIVAVLFGILTVLGTYLLTKKLFSYLKPFDSGYALAQGINSLSPERRPNEVRPKSKAFDAPSTIIALLSTFFLAISFWHVNFSRIGFRAIMVPFFLVWGLYFLFKALNATPIPGLHTDDPNKKHKLVASGYFLVAGLLFGLGFHTYIAFRVAPLIILPIFIIWIIKNRSRLKLTPWIIFVIFALIAAAPLLYYYAKNPADFMGRAGQVSIFASGSVVKTLIQSTVKTLGQFVAVGDYNWRHNISGSPEIFWPLIPFFIIGIIYSLWQIFRIKNYRKENSSLNTNYLSLLACHWTLLVWWGAMLLPSIMTSEGLPHALRSIGAIPPSYIFTGLGFYLIIMLSLRGAPFRRDDAVIPSNNRQKLSSTGSLISKWRLGMTLGVIFTFCIAVAYFSYKLYFVDWATNPIVKGVFTQRFVDEANYLKSLPTNIKKYVIVNEDGVPVPYPDGIPMPAQTIKFLDYNNSEITYLKSSQFRELLFQYLQAPTVILPMVYDNNLFEQLKQKYPNGKIDDLGTFKAFEVNF